MGLEGALTCEYKKVQRLSTETSFRRSRIGGLGPSRFHAFAPSSCPRAVQVAGDADSQKAGRLAVHNNRVRAYVGVTDDNWYRFLADRPGLTEVEFLAAQRCR